jgi:hydroxymethylpyrimidine kinase/phosphomethylpyrimidine kinase
MLSYPGLVFSADWLKDNTPVPVPIKKSRTEARPCALTIAGSDSGGGAGIQADIKTFAALGVHGTTALTCITAQNPKEVFSVQAVRPEIIRDQIEAVTEVLKPKSVKTGMLYSAEIIDAVCDELPEKICLIVDPVMIATSGALLLENDAIDTLKALLHRATLATPNLHEAEHLLNRKIQTVQGLRAAAREFHERFGCAALLKGGHLTGVDSAIDFYCDRSTELMLEAPFVRKVSTHGTGCTYSAAIAAYCALGFALPDAVAQAKEFITNSIAQSYKTSDVFALNPFWQTR